MTKQKHFAILKISYLKSERKHNCEVKQIQHFKLTNLTPISLKPIIKIGYRPSIIITRTLYSRDIGLIFIKISNVIGIKSDKPSIKHDRFHENNIIISVSLAK